MLNDPNVIIPNRLEIIDRRESYGLFTAAFKTKDLAEANLLKRAILHEIETYCIDIVIFDVNTSSRHDEIIALRLGQLVIDHTKLQLPATGDLTSNINVEGVRGTLTEFTTNHIKDIPFTYMTPITTLRYEERISCKVIVRKGQGKTHVKWRPVSKVIIKERQDWIELTIATIGMMQPEVIFREGYNKMFEAAKQIPINIYFHPVIPVDLIKALEAIERGEESNF